MGTLTITVSRTQTGSQWNYSYTGSWDQPGNPNDPAPTLNQQTGQIDLSACSTSITPSIKWQLDSTFGSVTFAAPYVRLLPQGSSETLSSSAVSVSIPVSNRQYQYYLYFSDGSSDDPLIINR
jgi:hypothetical protein